MTEILPIKLGAIQVQMDSSNISAIRDFTRQVTILRGIKPS